MRHEEIGDDGKRALEIEWGAQFQGTADLYTYFYFRGLDILRPGGHLTYITSNKFMRARYGERLREVLTAQSHIREIIDCGDTNVFEAIAYPAIYRLQKGTPDAAADVRIGTITSERELKDIPAHMAAEAFDQPQSSIGGDSWLLEPAEIRNLIAKLHASGQTLGDYLGDRIYRGVLTGFNDAFVIDTPTRDALVAADPKSAEIIKPWLRGRDIKRWKAEWAGLWVIAIASSSNRSWPWSEAKTLKKAESIFANTYPAVHQHLLPYRDRARKRHDKGVYWWELRSCSYYEAFERPKIVYPNIAKRNEFALETKGFLTNQKAFLIDSDDEALLAYLNSSVVDFWFRHRLPKLQNGFLEPSKVFLEKLPLPDDLEPLRQGDLHMPLGTVASPDANLDDLRLDAPDQFTIDFITWRMFDLDPSEIEIIERATGLREEVKASEDLIPAAITFDYEMRFPRLELTDADFPRFAEFFTPYLEGYFGQWIEGDDFGSPDQSVIWIVRQFTIEYTDGSTNGRVKVVVELMKATGALAAGIGTLFIGLAAFKNASAEQVETQGYWIVEQMVQDVGDDLITHCEMVDGQPASSFNFNIDVSKPTVNTFESLDEAIQTLPTAPNPSATEHPNNRSLLHIGKWDEHSRSFDIEVVPPDKLTDKEEK